MFYSITGKLVLSDPGYAVIDCNGVAFQCYTSLNTVKQLPNAGENVTLYTYLHVREDAIQLYGFFDMSELECFKQLLTVSGVGTRAAVAILSQLTPSGLMSAIAGGDINAIKKAQGIGIKIAQRIVLDLKGKINGIVTDEAVPSGSVPSGLVDGNRQQALEALTGLGYTGQEVAKVLSALDSELPVEDMIREGLKMLARQV